VLLLIVISRSQHRLRFEDSADHEHAAKADPNLTMDQFIDLCVLCGCDYTTSIRGIGPTTALKLIQTHGTIGTEASRCAISTSSMQAFESEQRSNLFHRTRSRHRDPPAEEIRERDQ
jgi:5'-3' exonuclease